jgi:hypothetical protein
MVWWILFAFGWIVAAFWAVGANRIPRFLRNGMIPGGYWEDAIKIYFAMVFMWGLKAWAVDSPSKDLYVGIGAFHLVRRAAPGV